MIRKNTCLGMFLISLLIFASVSQGKVVITKPAPEEWLPSTDGEADMEIVGRVTDFDKGSEVRLSIEKKPWKEITPTKIIGNEITFTLPEDHVMDRFLPAMVIKSK